MARVDRLPEWPAVRGGPQREGSAFAILGNDAESRKRIVAFAVIEKHPRPDDTAIEGREVGPSVAIEIAPRLQSASRGAVPQLRSSPPRLRRSLSQHHWNPLQSWIWERKPLKALWSTGESG